MTFVIKTPSDAYKFALALHDYLSRQGYSAEAEILSSLADSCYPNDDRVVDAHRKAFHSVRKSVKDLPPQYLQALNDALEALSD